MPRAFLFQWVFLMQNHLCVYVYIFKHKYKFLVEAQYDWNRSGSAGLCCVATVITTLFSIPTSSAPSGE